METPLVEDDEDLRQIIQLSSGYIAEGDYIKALEVTEDSILSHRKKKKNVPTLLKFHQGQIFGKMANRAEDSDVDFAFVLASAECFSVDKGISSFCTASLFGLGCLLGSSLYYKKAVEKAKEYLSVLSSFRSLTSQEQKSQTEIEDILKAAEAMIAAGSPVEKGEPRVRESKKNEDLRKNEVEGLRLYWMGLDVEMKRDFMKVRTSDFMGFVERLYGAEGRDALMQVLTFGREDRKWRVLMCRSCSQKFSSAEECKNHLEQEHDAAVKLSSSKYLAQRISKVWARKISRGGWEPVDAVAAVGMIKNRLEDVKAFEYENGWSKDWPIAADDKERSKLLQEIGLLLESFCERKILSCSVRNWVMQFVVNHLESLQVSKDTLTDCRLVETPQSICFLECRQLNRILEFLRNIKCQRNDGTDVVGRAVESFCSGTQVKEKLDFDIQFSFLLLDKRLLQGKIARFDDDVTVNFLDPNVYYAKAHPHGDEILSWLTDCCSGDESFRFPRPIRTHNLDIWLAVLRAVHFTRRSLETKYKKKGEALHYDAFLTIIKDFCIREDGKRRDIPEDQWKTYASLMCDDCEKHLRENDGNSLETKMFFAGVLDVLDGASYPTFDYHDSQVSINVIRERKNVSDDMVLKSIDSLKVAVTNKVPLIDSKILLIEKSRANLLNYLTRLCVFDYRSYILPLLKEFLLLRIIDVESIAKLAAAEADLLLEEGKRTPRPTKKKNKSSKEELDGTANMDAKAKVKEKEKKNSGSKKKKHKSIKRTSTSTSSLLDQNVKHESSVNLEAEVASPSLKTVAEDTFSSESSRLEILSNTNNQEEATKDMQKLPGEDSLSEDLGSVLVEGAARCNSALDMTLKALCNIKVLIEYLVHNRHQFADNLEEQVSAALQNFFAAFLSKQIEEEGLHSYLRNNLLASLEEVHSMSSNAAELLVAILEFWPCWKSPEIESVVTRIFTLEEYERMSCSKCRKEPNYPEQSSYGIVMAAESIRDLKCAFGKIKFVDILKMIRMGDKMLCDIKSGGCGEANFVHHVISNCPPIFTIVLEWEKNETEEEISETTKALDWEIDISKLYKGLEPNTMYRLVSMVGCGEEEEHICLVFKKNRWISFRHDSLVEEGVGKWKSVVSFCGERKVRPEILFYESVRLMA